MAKENSFDIVSELNMQEVDNGVNQAVREISVRYDLKDSKSKISLDKTKKEIEIVSPDEFKLKSIMDVLQSKLFKRGISLKVLKYQKVVSSLGGTVSLKVDLVDGLPSEKCREIAKLVRDSKLKVKVQVEGEKVRVSSPSKDILQQVMGIIKEKYFDIPLQFVNYR